MRLKKVGLIITSLSVATAAAMMACGSSDDSTAALFAADSGSGGDGAAGGDSGIGSDAAGGDAAGGDGGVIVLIDGGTPSNPGAVTCGSATCTSPAFCCADPADGGASCQTGGGSCPGNAGHLECDETADCNTIADAAQLVCCYEVADGVVSSACHADCNGGGGNRLQACKSQAECTTGTCAAHTCLDGQHIESCKADAPACP